MCLVKGLFVYSEVVKIPAEKKNLPKKWSNGVALSSYNSCRQNWKGNTVLKHIQVSLDYVKGKHFLLLWGKSREISSVTVF